MWLRMFPGLDHEAVNLIVADPTISPGADFPFWSKETSRHPARSWARAGLALAPLHSPSGVGRPCARRRAFLDTSSLRGAGSAFPLRVDDMSFCTPSVSSHRSLNMETRPECTAAAQDAAFKQQTDETDIGETDIYETFSMSPKFSRRPRLEHLQVGGLSWAMRLYGREMFNPSSSSEFKSGAYRADSGRPSVIYIEKCCARSKKTDSSCL